jgi:hypothetical protein
VVFIAMNALLEPTLNGELFTALIAIVAVQGAIGRVILTLALQHLTALAL